MAVAQGLLKQTVFAKQSVLGTTVTTGGKIKRRTNSKFALARDTYTSQEILSHQQDTGAIAGIQKTSGKLDGELSAGTWSEFFGSLLRKLGATTADITAASFTIAASGSFWTLTRASGSFLTDGVKAGDVVRITAGTYANAVNKNNNLLVLAVNSATQLLVKPINGTSLVAEGPITGSTLNIPGKKYWVPTSGHTNEYWTVEEWYSDLGKSEVFGDVKIGKADLTIPATGIATVSFDCPGLSRTRSGAQYITSPAVETTTLSLSAVAGSVIVNGVVTPITGAQLTIDGQVKPGEAEVGSNAIGDHVRGPIMVSGSFTSKFSTTLLQDIYDAQSVIKLFLVISDASGNLADFVAITLSAIKLFGDDADDGEAKEIIRTYPFTAQINGSGGAALADLQTIISIQDSQGV